MKKYIAFIATLLFFACVTVFTMQMKQDDANADLSLTEKVSIMANAGDGGDGDEDEGCNAGGPGSNGCGIKAEIWQISYECEVSCAEGYSCCYLTWEYPFVVCECIVE